MTKQQEFARRINTLFATRKPDAGDLRSAELSIMIDVFLGKKFDARKRIEIVNAQRELHGMQESLVKRFQAGELNATEYIDSLNLLIREGFARCRSILGSKDFKKLFGKLYTQKEFLDRSEFLANTSSENPNQSLGESPERTTRVSTFETRVPTISHSAALRMTERDVNGITVLYIGGRMGLGESSDFRERVASLLAAGKKKIVLNMADVSHIDSAGLGTLVAAFHSARSQGATLKLAKLSSKFLQVLKLMKLVTVFDVFESDAAAVGSFKAQRGV